MTARAAVLSWALAFGVLHPAGTHRAGAEEEPKAKPAAADLSGRWVLNPEGSDDAREKMREGMPRGGGPGGGRPPMGPGGGGMGGPGAGGGGRGGGGRMGPPSGMAGGDDPREAMRAIFEPAEELVIGQTATEIAVDEKSGRIRRLHPDGKKYKTDNGAAEIKTAWREGKLVIETKRARGASVVETWELVPDGSRIIVNVRYDGGFGPKVELKRLYDRGEADEPAAGEPPRR